MKRLLPLLLLSCSQAAPEEPSRLQAMITHAPNDTARFAVPAVARYCADRQSVLLEAVSEEGNGVLVRLKYDNPPDSGTFVVLPAGETTPTPIALVSVRYLARQMAHTFALDSGTVSFSRRGNAISAHVSGRGFDNSFPVSVVADYRDVPFAPDTVPCRYQP